MNFRVFIGSPLIANQTSHKHTHRWATHGGKTDENAHPHMDYNNRIALVHNGTINNAQELRSELQSKGIEFRSETDTEVLLSFAIVVSCRFIF